MVAVLLTASACRRDVRGVADGWRSAQRLIDLHMHLDLAPAHLDRAVEVMNAAGIGVAVNLSGGTTTVAAEDGQLSRFERTKQRIDGRYPGRFVHYMNLDLRAWDDPDFSAQAVAQVEAGARLGAAGLKFFKNFGLFERDKNGAPHAKIDPRLDAMWQTLGELGMPVSIHVADPKAFWGPYDASNERWDELKDHPSWWFGDPAKYPPREQLLNALERVIARHPETTFVCVHFGNNAEDLAWVDAQLVAHPNMMVDIAARIPEIGRQDAEKVRRIFIKHAARILFGTDFQSLDRMTLGSGGNGPPPTVQEAITFYQKHGRFFETADRNFAHMTPIQGNWTISGIHLPAEVLQQIYFGNAQKLLARALAQLPPPTGLKSVQPGPPPIDLVTTSGAVDHWPNIIPAVVARSFSSYDRAGGNDDGFRGTYSQLYAIAGNDQHIIFDARGPGALRTLWLAAMGDFPAGDIPRSGASSIFYFDDETQPRIDLDCNELFDGTHAPFLAPLVAGPHVSTGGYASWSDLAYQKRLVITTEHLARFYQAFYDTFPADWTVTTWTPGAFDSALATRMSAAGFAQTPLTPIPLDWTTRGAGQIDVVRFTPKSAPSIDALRAARITIAFDDASTAQINAPLGLFFGAGLGAAHLRAAAWAMDPPTATSPGVYEMHLPMPYFKSAHLSVTGLDGTLAIHRAPLGANAEDLGILEAHETAAQPTVVDQDFVYADIGGAGKLVATALAIDPLAPEAKQWWEGDMRTYVDGSVSPSFNGTGHEDDHLGGWSNTFFEYPFSLYFQGEPAVEMIDHRPTVPQYNARISLYRFFPDVTFLGGLHHSTEHGRHNDRDANYRAVTFVYRQTRPRLVSSDAVIVDDADSAKRHEYHATYASDALTSQPDGIPVSPTTAVAHHYLGDVSFHLDIEPDNRGVYLRRLFDQIDPASEARVEVDGVNVGSWYIADNNPIRRWAERDFYLPAQVTRGKKTLHIHLYPSHALSAARFTALYVLP